MAIVPAMIAAVVVLAGCGGGSKPLSSSEYVNQVNAVAKDLTTATGKLGSATNGPAAAAQLTVAQAALKRAGGQLGAITPPPAIKTPHRQLVKAVDELANELTPVIARLKTGDLSALAAALSLKGVGDAQRAIAAITKAGYKIQIPLVS